MSIDFEISLGPYGISSYSELFGSFTEYCIPYGDSNLIITIYSNGYATGTNSTFKYYYDRKLKRLKYIKHDIILLKTVVDSFVELYKLKYIGE